mmetsp:Transcript_4584/g.15084  ORF Transcript_4584/g.15084 Transcript_4584/m.15084 type:complete len:95 (-) Transcript_4584:973-1257(-)
MPVSSLPKSKVLLKFVLFSIALWGAPIGTFLALHNGGAQVLAPWVGFHDLEPRHLTTFSAAASILVVQLVIAAYVASALREPQVATPAVGNKIE